MKRSDVTVIEKSRPFDGYFKIDRYTVRHRLFEGGWSEPFTREVFERGHATVVLLYDADLDCLVFVEQFRIGAHAALSSTAWWDGDLTPWLVECVAGIIDEGETPDQVARREATEESGCEIRELIPIQRVMASPGGCSETVFVFCGQIDASKAGGIHGLDAEHEDIRVLVVPAAEAFEWLESGRFVHSITIIAVHWFRQRHRHLRAAWRAKVR